MDAAEIGFLNLRVGLDLVGSALDEHAALLQHGYLLDQFLWSGHVESIALFVK